jgi:pimeloyl-ACP methyl ester carboxylesterase
MKKYILLLFLNISLQVSAKTNVTTDTLSFIFEGKKLSGILDMPATKVPSGLIILIPGSGQTNMVAWKWNAELRNRFVQEGFACYVWDKAGCGKSEGVFDGNQSVQSSAKEGVEAINELKRRNIPGSEKIGLWGHSRAGWICPLIISDFPEVKFWISVSGTDDKENYGYLLEKNFLIEGRSKKETKKLMDEWQSGFDITRHGGTFEENLKATENLRNDPFYMFMSNNSKPTQEGFLRWQKKFQTGETIVDKKSGLQVYIPDFEKVLRKINCPVLAIFGEKDTQVDWRRTISLYKKTIGKNPKSQLTIKTFPNGNHNIFKSITGGYREKLVKNEACDGYYDTMLVWLKTLSKSK